MARKFVASSSEYLYSGSPGITDSPLTLAAWINPANDTTQHEAVQLVYSAGSSVGVAIGMRKDGATFKARMRAYVGSTNYYAWTGAANTDQWQHVCGRIDSGDDFECALDGVFGSTTTTTGNLGTGFTRHTIGALADSTPSNYCDAGICGVAVWNVTLTDDEVTQLALGVSPLKIRRANLVRYIPLINDEDVCYITGNAYTANGTPDTQPGPKLILPKSYFIFPPSIAGGPSGQTITATGIASAEAHGTQQFNLSLLAQAIASGEAFGSTQFLFQQFLQSAGGIASAEAHGAQQFNLTLLAQAIASGEAFGSATLQALATITPNGIASAEAHGSSVLQTSGSITASSIASGEAIGDLSLLPGAVTISPNGVASAEAIGSHALTVGGLSIAPNGIASAEAIGDQTLQPGSVTIQATSIISGEAVGGHTLSSAIVILPTGIASAEIVGDHILIQGAAIIAPGGIASGEAFGAITIVGGTDLIKFIEMFLKIEPSVDMAATNEPSVDITVKLN